MICWERQIGPWWSTRPDKSSMRCILSDCKAQFAEAVCTASNGVLWTTPSTRSWHPHESWIICSLTKEELVVRKIGCVWDKGAKLGRRWADLTNRYTASIIRFQWRWQIWCSEYQTNIGYRIAENQRTIYRLEMRYRWISCDLQLYRRTYIRDKFVCGVSQKWYLNERCVFVRTAIWTLIYKYIGYSYNYCDGDTDVVKCGIKV